MKNVVTRLRANTDTVLLIFDLTGVFVFAVEGALAAMKAELDVFGLLVLSFATALGGGMLRDLLIGATPPQCDQGLEVWSNCICRRGAVFCFSNLFQTVPVNLMLVLDAAGLALCAVAGVTKALDFNIHGMLAVLMGALTGVGGGTLRDLMLARVPNVLKSDIYAVAAIVGATVIVLGLKAQWPRTWVMMLGGVTCFVLRMVAVWQHWNLPKVMAH